MSIQGMAFSLYSVSKYLEPVPQISYRNRCIQFYHFFGYRMNETHTTCMQTDTAIRIGTGKTIFQISLNRASHFSQLATYLMVTAGFKIDL